MRALQATIAAWSRGTFPQQSNVRLYNHLQEEMTELAAALFAAAANPGSMEAVGEEIADCLILLLCLASYCEIDAATAVSLKHSVNTQRTYRFDPELGYDRKVDAS